MIIQRYQLFRQADLVGKLDQRLAPLGLLDLFRALQQRFQISELIDQQGGGLDPDPGRTRHVVDTVPRQRLNIDHPFRPDAELGLHPFAINPVVLHRVEHFHAAAHELHQVLVGTDDRAAPPGLARLTGQRGDDVIGFVVFLLKTGDVEGARGLACQRKLRHQVFGRGRTVGLVKIVEIVSERLARMVEHHRHMGRRIGALVVLDLLEQHVAKARDGPDRQPVGLSRQGRQRMIGAEDEGRAVHQMQMMPFAECHVPPSSLTRGLCVARGRGFGEGQAGLAACRKIATKNSTEAVTTKPCQMVL